MLLRISSMIVMRFSITGNPFITFSTKLDSKHGNIGEENTLSLAILTLVNVDFVFFVCFFGGLCCILLLLGRFSIFVRWVRGEVEKF